MDSFSQASPIVSMTGKRVVEDLEEEDPIESSDEDHLPPANEYELARKANIASLQAYLQPALKAADDLYVSSWSNKPYLSVLRYLDN